MHAKSNHSTMGWKDYKDTNERIGTGEQLKAEDFQHLTHADRSRLYRINRQAYDNLMAGNDADTQPGDWRPTKGNAARARMMGADK